MKAFILVLIIAASGLTSFTASANSTSGQSTTQSTIENTEGPRKPGNNKNPHRMRSGVFTVNVLHFNKRIREKHDKEMKALFAASNKKSGKEKRADRKAKRTALQTTSI